MLELILGGILFACCAYTGIGIRSYYRKRKEIYEQYAGYLDYLQEDIGFLKTPLVESTREYCRGKKGEFIKILSRYCTMLEEGKTGRAEFDELFASPYVEKRQRKEIASVKWTRIPRQKICVKLGRRSKLRSTFIKRNTKQRVRLLSNWAWCSE